MFAFSIEKVSLKTRFNNCYLVTAADLQQNLQVNANPGVTVNVKEAKRRRLAKVFDVTYTGVDAEVQLLFRNIVESDSA